MTTWYENQAFTAQPIGHKDPLPALAVIALDNWSLITASGEDTVKYLQGQFTCDVTALGDTESTMAAHCDAKGKMWAAFRLFHHRDGLAYSMPASQAETELNEIRKYAIFSKITFAISEDILLGLTGTEAGSAVDTLFGEGGEVRHNAVGTAALVAENQWLLAVNREGADKVLATLDTAVLADNTLWDLFDIKAALPRIEAETSAEHIPQAMNLQAVGGVSFSKGCYTGQETVARAKYRGINKRAMYLLAGEAPNAPKAGDMFERQVGENWRSGGTVVAGYLFADGQALALAVLPNNLEEETAFRLEGQDAVWQRLPLPYSLDDE
ncbi:tRNA-modifying protein YgfZ [Parasalinivibrio latis]|uniref:tRNA-modifying protein YgfZ n=1 Tax=Parasalinivibrio latis TaxID=2952610 RepID=UPI0030E30749